MYKMLVAYDFSPMSDGALAWAVARARRNGAVLKVVHVAVVSSGVDSSSSAAPLPGKSELDRLRADIQSAVARFGAEADVHVVVGANPGGEIVIAANEFGADEIVMGTRGVGGIRRALLGSV